MRSSKNWEKLEVKKKQFNAINRPQQKKRKKLLSPPEIFPSWAYNNDGVWQPRKRINEHGKCSNVYAEQFGNQL